MPVPNIQASGNPAFVELSQLVCSNCHNFCCFYHVKIEVAPSMLQKEAENDAVQMNISALDVATDLFSGLLKKPIHWEWAAECKGESEEKQSFYIFATLLIAMIYLKKILTLLICIPIYFFLYQQATLNLVLLQKWRKVTDM